MMRIRKTKLTKIAMEAGPLNIQSMWDSRIHVHSISSFIHK